MTAKRVICAVILRDGKALLARRAPGQKHAGLWEFPGGKTEPDESDEACLEREMREEFGVTGKTGAHLCDSEYAYGDLGLSILLRAYRYTPETEAFDLRVHDGIGFFGPIDLDALPLSAADRPIAERVKTILLQGENKACGS